MKRTKSQIDADEVNLQSTSGSRLHSPEKDGNINEDSNDQSRFSDWLSPNYEMQETSMLNREK